ncbi:Phospholipase/carboxylesterase [Ramaria rubella]|nr:Phospholipase/carboxylesterase [Ramaria rubella]
MATLQPLKFLTLQPILKHSATVIFLHGLGDTGDGWEPVARMLQRDASLGHIKWVLPHARVNPVTINFGMEMPSWYDILSLTDLNARAEDEAGLLSSARSINELITSEIDASPEVGASRIVLGGFSQGGAMALLTGLTTERHLAGLVALSSYLPLREKMKSMMTDHAKKLPIFMGHGSADPVVAFKYGRGSYIYLKEQLGFSTVESSKIASPGIRFEQYDGLGHSADPKELEHLGAWLKAVVPQEK